MTHGEERVVQNDRDRVVGKNELKEIESSTLGNYRKVAWLHHEGMFTQTDKVGGGDRRGILRYVRVIERQNLEGTTEASCRQEHVVEENGTRRDVYINSLNLRGGLAAKTIKTETFGPGLTFVGQESDVTVHDGPRTIQRKISFHQISKPSTENDLRVDHPIESEQQTEYIIAEKGFWRAVENAEEGVMAMSEFRTIISVSNIGVVQVYRYERQLRGVRNGDVYQEVGRSEERQTELITGDPAKRFYDSGSFKDIPGIVEAKINQLPEPEKAVINDASSRELFDPGRIRIGNKVMTDFVGNHLLVENP